MSVWFRKGVVYVVVTDVLEKRGSKVAIDRQIQTSINSRMIRYDDDTTIARIIDIFTFLIICMILISLRKLTLAAHTK